MAITFALFSIATARPESGERPATETLASTFDHTHAGFTNVLAEYVRNGKVDYAALKKSPAKLNAYLHVLAAVSKPTFEKWNRNQQMTFLINLYNAATLKLIIDHYPVKSIKDIGGFFRNPWKIAGVPLFGGKVTLDHVEHDLLRARFGDPRIHFAVNCASIGCPELRKEAFDAARLDAQLDEQGRRFLGDKSKNRLDANRKTLYLSPIFKWFESDFTGHSGTLEKFVAPYFNDADREVIKRGGLSIKYTDYDWSLNSL